MRTAKIGPDLTGYHFREKRGRFMVVLCKRFYGRFMADVWPIYGRFM